ncbi:MAG: hypothetical protein AAGJ84_13250, partial [Pseudomonadota bacterium]
MPLLSKLCGIFAAGLVFATGSVAAQTPPADIPANASPKPFGSGWSCDAGFIESGTLCVAVALPENAYLTGGSFNGGWSCSHGFLRSGASCDAVEIPANAFLRTDGVSWDCDRGFRERGNRCAEIQIPENGFLTDEAGDGWDCERGFEKDGQSCEEIFLPANSYLSGSTFGDAWRCERGFTKRSDTCETVVLPKVLPDRYEFAGRKISSQLCQSCEEIFLPANSYLSGSTFGDAWRC